MWRWFTAPFVHGNLGFQFVTLVAGGIFGSLLERRFGRVPVVLVFVLSARPVAAGRRRSKCRRCLRHFIHPVRAPTAPRSAC